MGEWLYLAGFSRRIQQFFFIETFEFAADRMKSKPWPSARP